MELARDKFKKDFIFLGATLFCLVLFFATSVSLFGFFSAVSFITEINYVLVKTW